MWLKLKRHERTIPCWKLVLPVEIKDSADCFQENTPWMLQPVLLKPPVWSPLKTLFTLLCLFTSLYCADHFSTLKRLRVRPGHDTKNAAAVIFQEQGRHSWLNSMKKTQRVTKTSPSNNINNKQTNKKSEKVAVGKFVVSFVIFKACSENILLKEAEPGCDNKTVFHYQEKHEAETALWLKNLQKCRGSYR